MVDLIQEAYGVDTDKILGGPSWVEWNRYDIAAKAPPGTTAESANMMLRALLADRFKLVVHKDTKPVKAYALSVGKKSLLKESQGGGESGCKIPQGYQIATPGAPPAVLYNCRNVTMEAFAAALRNMVFAPQYLNGLAVADQTGLKGAWDFDLKYSNRPGVNAGGTNLYDAIDKQLGLKLEQGQVPMPVIMVDRANDKPTANVANIAALLPPPPPTEFEVATLKPTSPDFNGGRFQVQNGRVNIAGIPLAVYVNQIWDFDERVEVVGLPDWANTDRYDLVAKAPAGALSMSVTPDSNTNTAPADADILFSMLKNLMIDRFQIKAHYEDQTRSAFNLVASKPKLKAADPSNRTGCKDGPGPDGKDPRIANPQLNRLVTCLNISMAQFADQLQNMAGGYVHSPVLDKTGIEGSFDFTLSFSGAGIIQGGGRGEGGGRGGDAPQAGQPNASDPSGGISLMDAINKELGVKLEEVKRPVRVLVVDHVNRTPSDN
jgi:uncharacterized protein (TIGR03435 family)